MALQPPGSPLWWQAHEQMLAQIREAMRVRDLPEDPANATATEVMNRLVESQMRIGEYAGEAERALSSLLWSGFGALRYTIRRAPVCPDTFQMLEDMGIEPASVRVRYLDPTEYRIVSREIAHDPG